MGAVARHAEERHAAPDGRLLRYRDGRPVTYRRYDGLWVRIGRHLPWVRAQQISMRWLHHTWLPLITGLSEADIRPAMAKTLGT
jgi:integrase/recombinase XerC